MVGSHYVNLAEFWRLDKLDREPSEEQYGEPIEDLVEVLLYEKELRKTYKMGSALTGQLREELIQFLCEHQDVFSWLQEDMSRIGPSIVFHYLNIDPNFKPVKQKHRAFNIERYMVIIQRSTHFLKLALSENPNILTGYQMWY